MEYSDDKPHTDETNFSVDTENTPVGADGISAPMSTDNNVQHAATTDSVETRGAEAEAAADKPDGVFSLVGIALKTISLTIAFILVITSILAVTLPLTTMRVFNKLGMTERAVDFGERYIARELKSYKSLNPDADGNYNTADYTEADGFYSVLNKTEDLTNDDFLEALYVCINNSYKLMNDSYRAGDNRMGEYYATRVEKYTRMYLSLSGVMDVNRKRSEQNVLNMPLFEMRPMAYSYGHTMLTMNYRARAYLAVYLDEKIDELQPIPTDTMLYNSNGGNVVATLSELTNSVYGTSSSDGSGLSVALIDRYVDYIDSIGEYLDVEFIRAGVQNDMSATFKYNGVEMPVWVETAVREQYSGKLGNGYFSIIVRNTGFTNIYNNIVNGNSATEYKFATFVDSAVDFVPNGIDERLHQLYWLQALRSTAIRLTYLNYLLYFNSDSFGAASAAVRAAQFDLRDGVFVDKLTNAYIEKLNEYKALYQTV